MVPCKAIAITPWLITQWWLLDCDKSSHGVSNLWMGHRLSHPPLVKIEIVLQDMLVLQSTTTRHSNLREALSENVSTQLGLVGSSNNPVPSIEIHAGIWDEELMSESGFWHVLAIGIILIGEGINSFYVSRYPPCYRFAGTWVLCQLDWLQRHQQLAPERQQFNGTLHVRIHPEAAVPLV